MKHTKSILIIPIALLSLTTAAFSHCGVCEEVDNTHAGHDSISTEHHESMLASYLSIQESLAADDLDTAKTTAASYVEQTDSQDDLLKTVSVIAEADDIAEARKAFLTFSNLMIAKVESGELSESQPLSLAHCPMAFKNKGGAWLQSDETVVNPYFGSMMLHCGTTTKI